MAKNEWLLKELHNHRETESAPLVKKERDLGDLCAKMPNEETPVDSEELKRRRELKQIHDEVTRFQSLSNARFNVDHSKAEHIFADRERVLEGLARIQLPALEQLITAKSIGEIAFAGCEEVDETIRYKD